MVLVDDARVRVCVRVSRCVCAHNFFGLNVCNMRAHMGEDTRGNTLAGVGERVWMVMVHAVRVHVVCVCVSRGGRGSGAVAVLHAPARTNRWGMLVHAGRLRVCGRAFFFSRPMMKACMMVVRVWPQTVGPFLAGPPSSLFVTAPPPPLFVLSPCARQTHS